MSYKFRFLRERFACNVPLKDKTHVAVDVTDGQYQTENKEVYEYLRKRSLEPNSDIVSLDNVDEILATPEPRIKIVAGGRSSKDV